MKLDIDLSLATWNKYLMGLLLALFLTVGRWSPARILNLPGVNADIFQVRIWLGVLMILGLLIEGVVMICRDRDRQEGTAQDILILYLLTILFFLYISFTYFWAEQSELASYKLYEILLIALGISAIIFSSNREHLKDTFYFWTTLILISLAFSGALSLLAADQSGRLAVWGGGPNVYGRFMGILLLIGLHRTFEARKRLIWAAVSVLAVILLTFTGSRGAFFSAAISASILIGLHAIKNVKVLRYVFVLTAILCIVLALAAPLRDPILNFLQNRIIDSTLIQRYSAGRYRLYAESISIFLSEPLSGAGLEVFKARGIRNYPHNLFLEVAMEGGTVGLVLLFLIFFSLLCVLAVNTEKRKLDLLGLSIFFLFVIASQFSGDLFDNRGIFLFALLSYKYR